MLDSLFGKPNINRMKSKGDIPGLINVLGHTQEEVVREAVTQALIQIGEPAIDALRKLVRKSYNASMSDIQREELIRAKYYAILCLVQIGDTEAVDPLIHAMKYGESSIKEVAYSALTKLTTAEKIVPPLLYELAIGSTESFSNCQGPRHRELN